MSGIGYDRAAELGEWVKEHHELRRVVTNLAVLDFDARTTACAWPACTPA